MLTVNISELLLTVLSFFVLFFLLNKLLFKPVISFREQRQSRIDEGFERERLAKEQQAGCEAGVQQKRSASLKEAEGIAARAKAQAEAASLEAEERMEAEAETAMSQAAKEAEQLRVSGSEALAAERSRLAKTLADRLSQ